MRKAINENPVVQISVLGVLLLVVGFLLVTRVLKGEDAETAPAAGEPIASEVTPPSVAASGGTGDPAVSAGVAPAVPAGGSTTVTPAALVPGPGLPPDVKAAWNRGSAIVLLIVRGGATDDRLVRASVDALASPDVSVFVTRAKHIARYSRITQGVGVSRVPALVVVRPKALSGSVPDASVSYGFRNAQSVAQAVDDALYAGRDHRPYHPG